MHLHNRKKHCENDASDFSLLAIKLLHLFHIQDGLLLTFFTRLSTADIPVRGASRQKVGYYKLHIANALDRRPLLYKS